MLSSNDIASMFAAQQSQFAAQGAFAQQITANSGIAQPPNNSLANWGQAPARAPAGPSPFPNAHPMPPSFSYNPAVGMSGITQGYGGGNRFASGMMSAAGAMGGIGSMALGFTPLAGLVDPIAGGIGGFAAGGIGGAALGAALPLALGYGAAKVGGAFMEGGQQRMQMNTTLGQNFTFMNPASRTGQGFNRNDVAQITSTVRGLAETPELLTSFQELNSLIPKLRQSGAFSGVRDAHEFNTRFKESVKTLRDMSKILGSTMEEAASFFQQSRQLGFTSPASQRANAINVKFTAAATGMSTDQVFGMQAAGASMAGQMGIRRNIGARAVTNMAQQLQGQIDAGGLDQGLLEDLSGGMTGDEAMGGAAANLTGAIAGLAKNTSFGKQSLLAITKFDETGRAIGIDQEKARRLQEGTLSWDEQKRIVSKFNKRQKMSAVSHMDSLSMEYAGSAGMAGFASQVAGMRDRGYDDEAIRLQLTKLTGSENMSDALMQMEGKISDAGGMQQMMQKMARDAARRERRDPKAILEKIKTKLHRETLGHVEEIGGKFFDKIAEGYDQFWDDVFEDYTITMSKEGGERLKNAFNGAGEGEVAEMFNSALGAGIEQAKLRRSNIGAGDIFKAQMGGLMSGAAKGGMFGGFGNLVGGYGGMVIEGARTGLLGLRETELAASLMGRTEGSQYRMQMGRFLDPSVAAGMTDEAADRSARFAMSDLEKFGGGLASLDQGHIRSAVQNKMAADEKDFYGMSASQRYEAARDTLAESLGRTMNEERGFGGSLVAGIRSWGDGTGGSVTRMMKSNASYADIEKAAGGRENVSAALQKQLGVSAEDASKIIDKSKGGQSFVDSIAAITGFGKDASEAMGGFDSAMYNATAAQRAEKMKAADAELTDKLGGAGAAMVKARPHLARALMDEGGLGKIAAALKGKTEAEQLQALSEIVGAPVTHDEMVTIRGMMGHMQDADKKKDMQSAVRTMAQIQSANDLAIHRDGVQKLAAGISGKDEHSAALKSALNDYSGATDEKSYKASRAKVSEAMSSTIARISKLSGKEQEAALAALGDAGSAVRSAINAKGKLQKGMSRGDLEEYLSRQGVGGDELKNVLEKYGGTGSLSEAAVSDIQKSIGTAKLGGAAAKNSSMTTGDKDQELINTMKEVQSAIDLNTTVILSGQFGDADIEKGKTRLNRARGMMKGPQETTPSSKNATAPTVNPTGNAGPG